MLFILHFDTVYIINVVAAMQHETLIKQLLPENDVFRDNKENYCGINLTILTQKHRMFDIGSDRFNNSSLNAVEYI